MDFTLGHTYSSHHVLEDNTLQTLQDGVFINRNILTCAGPSHPWLQIPLVSLAPSSWVSSGLLQITLPVVVSGTVSLFPSPSFLYQEPLQPLRPLTLTRPYSRAS